MIQVIGWIVFAIVVLFLIVNAAFMLISPQAWFRLPGWVRTQGALTEARFGRGSGALQLQIAGGLMLAVFGWVIYQFMH
jgi:hypothetical protein